MGLGERMRVIRESRGKSQQVVAEETGLSQAYISSLESGAKVNPTKKALTLVAESLGVEPEVLTDEKAALPQEIIDLPLDIVSWVANKKNIEFIVFAKKAQEKGLTPDEMERVIEFYRSVMKGQM